MNEEDSSNENAPRSAKELLAIAKVRLVPSPPPQQIEVDAMPTGEAGGVESDDRPITTRPIQNVRREGRVPTRIPRSEQLTVANMRRRSGNRMGVGAINIKNANADGDADDADADKNGTDKRQPQAITGTVPKVNLTSIFQVDDITDPKIIADVALKKYASSGYKVRCTANRMMSEPDDDDDVDDSVELSSVNVAKVEQIGARQVKRYGAEHHGVDDCVAGPSCRRSRSSARNYRSTGADIGDGDEADVESETETEPAATGKANKQSTEEQSSGASEPDSDADGADAPSDSPPDNGVSPLRMRSNDEMQRHLEALFEVSSNSPVDDLEAMLFRNNARRAALEADIDNDGYNGSILSAAIGGAADGGENNEENNDNDTAEQNQDEGEDDDDDDEDNNEVIARANPQPEDNNVINDVLNKPKSNYTWNYMHELRQREHGLSGNGLYSLRSGCSNGFNSRFYASRHVVERMKLSHCLRKHNGCVNCLNFSRNGELLCTGSDDTRIIIWDWANNKTKHVFKSGHTENIFQTKFIDGSGGLDIVSTSRDGQIRRSIVRPSGTSKADITCLYSHRGPVHKIVVCPQSQFEIISVGEDAYIRHKDLRVSGGASEMLKVVTGRKSRRVRLFSIAHHPYAPEICVSGCDSLVRVYDKRDMSKTVHEMSPASLEEVQVTCSVYNSTGSEILSSYSGDRIYLFNNKSYKPGEFLHCYRGHFNHRTIKGVNFFGPNSEYVVSGSDCGNLFFWDKETEAILNFIPADMTGVVNCLEPHPSIPILATSGLDHHVKIWTPSSQTYPPDLSKLETCVRRNLRSTVIDESNEFDDRQFHYFIRQFLQRPHSLSDSNDEDSNSNLTDANMWPSSTSSGSTTSDDDYPSLEGIQCRPQ